MDGLIQPEEAGYEYAEVDLVQYAHNDTDYFNDRNEINRRRIGYHKESYRMTIAGVTQATGDGQKVPEDEIEQLGLPEEWVGDGPVYRKTGVGEVKRVGNCEND